MGKEGLIVVKELKRLQSNLIRLDRFISSHVSRLLKSDLVAVLVELQRQNQVFLCMKVYPLLLSLSVSLYAESYMVVSEGPSMECEFDRFLAIICWVNPEFELFGWTTYIGIILNDRTLALLDRT